MESFKSKATNLNIPLTACWNNGVRRLNNAVIGYGSPYTACMHSSVSGDTSYEKLLFALDNEMYTVRWSWCEIKSWVASSDEQSLV